MLRTIAATFLTILVFASVAIGQDAYGLMVHSGSLMEATEFAKEKGLNFLVVLTDDRENATYKHFADIVLKDSAVIAELYDRLLVLDETPDSPNGQNLYKQYDVGSFPKIMFVTLEGVAEFEFEGKVDPDQFVDLYNRNLH